MAKKRQQYEIKRPEYVEDFHFFEIPVTDGQTPVQIPGTQIGVVAPAAQTEAERHARLVETVNAEVESLKQLLKQDAPKEQLRLEQSARISDVGSRLTHKQQLRLLNDLVSVKKALERQGPENRSRLETKPEKSEKAAKPEKAEPRVQDQASQCEAPAYAGDYDALYRGSFGPAEGRGRENAQTQAGSFGNNGNYRSIQNQ